MPKYQTEPEMWTSPPCRVTYTWSTLSVHDGQIVATAHIPPHQGAGRRYDPSPVWLGQVYRKLTGGDLNSLRPIAPEELPELIRLLE